MIVCFAHPVLQLDLSPGLVRTYEVTRDFRAVQGDDRMSYVIRLTYRVPKDANSKPTPVIVKHELLRTIFGGQTIEEPPAEKPLERKELRLPTGFVVSRELQLYYGSLQERQSRPLDVQFSPTDTQLGTKWQTTSQASAESGIPSATWSWECKSLSDKSVTLALDFKESDTLKPITADGTIVLDRASGWVESLDVVLHNTVVPGDSEGVMMNLSVKWRRL
ncbi:MAG: hypothetical protein JNM34_04055 [Chthonomonadaceae bacterium]|nr:hypothetical protein [Chthonomonadaceae bacterium]